MNAKTILVGAGAVLLVLSALFVFRPSTFFPPEVSQTQQNLTALETDLRDRSATYYDAVIRRDFDHNYGFEHPLIQADVSLEDYRAFVADTPSRLKSFVVDDITIKGEGNDSVPQELEALGIVSVTMTYEIIDDSFLTPLAEEGIEVREENGEKLVTYPFTDIWGYSDSAWYHLVQ